MKRLKTQFGSMILEQLAILALVGVMTVGGVYLYSEVTARFQADNIKSEALLRATSVLSSSRFAKADVGDQVLAAEFKRSSLPVTFTQTKISEALVVVSASQIRQKVCEKLRTAPMEKDLFSIYINCPNQDVSQCRSVAQGAGTCHDDRDNTVSFLVGKLKGRSIGEQPNDECPYQDMPSPCARPVAYDHTTASGETITCYFYEDTCPAPGVCRINGTCACEAGYQWNGETCVESACDLHSPAPYHNGSGCVQCLEDAHCPAGSGHVCQPNGFCAPGCVMDFSATCPSCPDPRQPYFNGGSCVCHGNSCGLGYTCDGGRCMESCDSSCDAYLKSHTDTCCQGYFCDTDAGTGMINQSSVEGTCNPVRYKVEGHWACSTAGNMNWFDAQAFCKKIDAQVPNATLVQAHLEGARTACGDLASVWLSEPGISDKLGWYADLGYDSTARVQTLSASSPAMHALCYRGEENPFPLCLNGAPCTDGRTCIGGLCRCAVNAYWDGNSCVACPIGWKAVDIDADHHVCVCADSSKCCAANERVITAEDGSSACEACAAGFEPDSAKTACQVCNANFTQTCATCTDPNKPYWDGAKCVAPVACSLDEDCTEGEVCVTASSKCSSCKDGTWRNNNCGGTPCTSGQHCALTGLNKWGWLTGLYCSGEGAGSGGGRSVNVVVGSKQYTYTYYDKGKHSWFESYNICEAMGASMPPASEISQNYQAISQALGLVAYVWSGDTSFGDSDQTCKADVVSLSTGAVSTVFASSSTTNFVTLCRMARASDECKYSGEKCVSASDCCDGAVCMNRQCEPCPANTYRSDNQCLTCGEGSSSLEGSAECTCAAGSIWDKGTNTCIQCAANTYQSGQECLPCENGSTAVAGSTKCACADGYYWDEEENNCYQCTFENAKEKCIGTRCTNQTHCGDIDSGLFCDNASSSKVGNVSYGYCALTGSFLVPSYSSSRDQSAVNNGIGTALLGSKVAAEAVLGGHFVVSDDRMKLGSAWGWCQAFGMTIASKAQIGDPTYGWDVKAKDCTKDAEGNNTGCPIVHALMALYSSPYSLTVNYHPIHPTVTGFDHNWMIIAPLSSGNMRYDFNSSTGYSSHALCWREDGTTTAKTCQSYSDCPSGYYCNLATPSDTCATTATTGRCVPLNAVAKVNMLIPGLGEVYYSKKGLNWWSAKDWCEAQGDRLLDASGNLFQCYTASHTPNTGAGYCCDKDALACNSEVGNQSSIMQALRKITGSTYLWTNTYRNNCYVYVPQTTSGYIQSAIGKGTSSYALCIKGQVTNCSSHSDCPSGYYCRYGTPSNACSSTITETGTCQPLGQSIQRYISGYGYMYLSEMTMNLWSAKDWCAAQGKKLIDIKDGNPLQCYNSSHQPMNFANYSNGYCCAQDAPSCSSGSDVELSPVIKSLQEVGNGFGDWSSTYFRTDTPSTSNQCNFYIINKYWMGNSVKATANYPALCVDP